MSTSTVLSSRRPIYVLDTPCLIRHYIIRFGEDIDLIGALSRRDHAKRQARLFQSINAFIRTLNKSKLNSDYIRGMKTIAPDEEISNNKNENSAEVDDRHSTAFTILELKGIIVEVMIDLHSEYFTVQMRAYPESDNTPTESLPANIQALRQRVRTALSYLSRGDKQHFDMSFPAQAAKAPDEAWKPHEQVVPENELDPLDGEMSELVRQLYDDFWYHVMDVDRVGSNIGLSPKRFFQRICGFDEAGAPQHLTADQHHQSAISVKRFEVMSILKGMILRRATVDGPETETTDRVYRDHISLLKRPNGTQDDFGKASHLINPRFLAGANPASQQFPGTSYDQIAEREFIANQNHVALFPRFFSVVLGFREGRTKELDHIAGNTVLCGVQDGLAVYGSAFHRHNPIGKRDSQLPIPEVRYFVVYSGPSRNQLSRLIRRLHGCGESRIFSLVDLKEVREAGDSLRAVDQELDSNLRERRHLDYQVTVALTAQAAEASRIVRGGLRHRVARSNYYRTKLVEQAQDLRERRIFGWQLYSDYIHRIYDPLLDTIKRIGERIESVEHKLSRADDLVDTDISLNIQRFGVPFVILGGIGIISEVMSNIFEEHRTLTFIIDILILAIAIFIVSVLLCLGISWRHMWVSRGKPTKASHSRRGNKISRATTTRAGSRRNSTDVRRKPGPFPNPRQRL